MKIRPNACYHLKNLCKLGLRPKFGLRTKSDLFYQVIQCVKLLLFQFSPHFNAFPFVAMRLLSPRQLCVTSSISLTTTSLSPLTLLNYLRFVGSCPSVSSSICMSILLYVSLSTHARSAGRGRKEVQSHGAVQQHHEIKTSLGPTGTHEFSIHIFLNFTSAFFLRLVIVLSTLIPIKIYSRHTSVVSSQLMSI